MSDCQPIDLPSSSGRYSSIESRLYVSIVLFILLIAAGLVECRHSQEGPALRISDRLSVGPLRLGQERSKEISEAVSEDCSPFDIVEAKLTAGSSSDSLSDGTSSLRRGLISRETLARRLGPPVGTCYVADSEVWIYDFTLSSPLNNGKELTSRGHLHVFLEWIPFLGLYLHHFELAIDGSGLERWPNNDPRLR